MQARLPGDVQRHVHDMIKVQHTYWKYLQTLIYPIMCLKDNINMIAYHATATHHSWYVNMAVLHKGHVMPMNMLKSVTSRIA